MHPEFAAVVAAAAFAEALKFFQPSDEWKITLLSQRIEEEEVAAQCWTKPEYQMGHIIYDPEQCEDGAEIWRVIGHEVAHLLSSEYNVLEQQLPRHYQHFSAHACERLTTRLERLFTRERPYPGDQHFPAGEATA